MEVPENGLMHNWHIAPREYARQEERRGKRFAYSTIHAPKTVFVVIDMVPFFISQNPYCRGIIPHIHALAEGLREAGGQVAWVLPASEEPSPWAREFYGSEIAHLYAASGGKGAMRDRFAPYFQPEPQDMLVEKTAVSAFFPDACPLHHLLRGRDIDTIVVAGTVTNICCESSVRDAATLGYRVIMVADANAAGRDEDHNASLHTIYRSFGDVRSTEDVLGMFRAK